MSISLVCLSIFLSIYQSICPPHLFIYPSLSLYLSINLFPICSSIRISLASCPPIHPSVNLSLSPRLFVYLSLSVNLRSAYPSIYLSIYLSIYPSIYLPRNLCESAAPAAQSVPDCATCHEVCWPCERTDICTTCESAAPAMKSVLDLVGFATRPRQHCANAAPAIKTNVTPPLKVKGLRSRKSILQVAPKASILKKRSLATLK